MFPVRRPKSIKFGGRGRWVRFYISAPPAKMLCDAARYARYLLVDLLVQLWLYHQIACRQSLFLAVNYMDRVVAWAEVGPRLSDTDILQLVRTAYTCLRIAAKFDEGHVFSMPVTKDQALKDMLFNVVEDLEASCNTTADDIFPAECSVFDMEIKILEKLRWRLDLPTVLDDIEQIQCENVRLNARELATIALSTDWYLVTDPSQIAAEVIAAATKKRPRDDSSVWIIWDWDRTRACRSGNQTSS